MKRALAARAADTYILASSEKIGAASPYQVLSLDEITGLITDAGPASPIIPALAARGVNVISA